jgi:hypothetical protein
LVSQLISLPDKHVIPCCQAAKSRPDTFSRCVQSSFLSSSFSHPVSI